MKEITLTVIFEGTIYSIEEANTHLYHVLHSYCAGSLIRSADELAEHSGATHFKMGFNGCGIDYGLSGLLFGSGLEAQCAEAEQVVKQLIKNGNKVTLNAIGLSRGGIASLLLAKQLGGIDQFHLEINLMLLDPVSGNALTTAYLDIFNHTLANKAMDLSRSMNLKRVTVLYPYLEIGDESGQWVDRILEAFHVPIRPTYPAHCMVKEDVILGAHLSAFQDLSTVEQQTHAFHGIDFIPIVRRLSKEIIYAFLREVNALSLEAPVDDSPTVLSCFIAEQEMWINWLREIIEHLAPKNRPLHSEDGSRLSATSSSLFLNKLHRELVGSTSESPADLCLKIIPERPVLEYERYALTTAELRRFIEVIQANITAASHQNRKGQLLGTLLDNLGDGIELSQKKQSFILRKILAIALQRDTNRYSFYQDQDTRLSDAIVTALNRDSDFPGISQCINPDNSPVSSSDLNRYVLGRDDSDAFSLDNRDRNLDRIEGSTLTQDLYPSLL